LPSAFDALSSFADPGIGVLDRVFYRVEHKLDYTQP